MQEAHGEQRGGSRFCYRHLNRVAVLHLRGLQGCGEALSQAYALTVPVLNLYPFPFVNEV